MDPRQLAIAGHLFILLLGPAAVGAAPQKAAPACSNAAPPTGSLHLVGPQVRVGDRLFAGADARVEVVALDAAGHPAQWKPVVDGREEAAWPASWSAGEHAVGAVLLDGCGNRGAIAPVAFQVDVEPPALRWEVGDRQRFADRLAPDAEPKRRHRRATVGEGRPAEDSWESVAGVWQVPIPWLPSRGNQAAGSRASFPVVIASDHPQAFLAAPDTTASVDGSAGPLGERLLWIAADDPGAGVDRLTLRLRDEGDRAVLEVEAADLAGNTSRKEIVLRKGR